MTIKPVYLVSEEARRSLIQLIQAEPLDGSRKVTISNAGSKSAKQRGLQWMWNEDVTMSGKGGKDECDVNRLHLVSKWRWCLPIQIRDDDMFADMYLNYHERHYGKHDFSKRIEWFVDNHVSTEALDKSQMSEYLKKFQDHYAIEMGVNLRDPDEFGWAGLLEIT